MEIAFIICASIVLIVGMSVGLDQGIKPFIDYKKKKLELDGKRIEEEHATAKLALMYQILDKRPELSLQDVQQLLETGKGKENFIEQK